MRVLTFEQFAAEQGASRQDIGDASFHCGAAHVSSRAREAQTRAQAAKDDALLARRRDLRIKYQRLCDAGEIRPPTAIECLEATAAGDPDKASTQAARRLLAKMRAA